MDKNIAAILREDAKTVSIYFEKTDGTRSVLYTYVTHFDVEEGDNVVVPVGAHEEWKVAVVACVHDSFEIEPNSDIKFKWIVGKIDVEGWRANNARNKEIESMLSASYRVNARQAYAAQFLNNADPKVLALVKGAE
jgi:hypothetical protein